MTSRARALFTAAFVRIWWVSFSAATAGFFLFPTAPFRLRELGAPPEASAWFLGGLTYGSALAAAWTGALGDVLGRRRVLVTAGLGLAALAALYAVVPDWRLLVALSLPHGVVWSSLLTSGNSELVHAVPAERRAEGIAWFGVATILAIAPAGEGSGRGQEKWSPGVFPHRQPYEYFRLTINGYRWIQSPPITRSILPLSFLMRRPRIHRYRWPHPRKSPSWC